MKRRNGSFVFPGGILVRGVNGSQADCFNSHLPNIRVEYSSAQGNQAVVTQSGYLSMGGESGSKG